VLEKGGAASHLARERPMAEAFTKAAMQKSRGGEETRTHTQKKKKKKKKGQKKKSIKKTKKFKKTKQKQKKNI